MAGNPAWQKGVSGNPAGRIPGTRNKRTIEIFTRLEERGDKDPADFLSEVVSDKSKPDDLRATCANMLLPYKYGKRGAVPAPRFVEDAIQVPEFQTVEQAQNFLALLSQRAGSGELELQSALDVSTLVKNWIISKQASVELDIKQANSAPIGEMQIKISGGLPALPGTNITMPQVNGHEHDLLPPQPPPTLQQNADGEYEPARDQEPTESVAASDSDGSVSPPGTSGTEPEAT